jgi:pimeloyl-ACP methyl ester carboxylesterase
VEEDNGRAGGGDLRSLLLAGAPVTERRLQLAGVSTAVLEGGDGPPVVLLHGRGGWAGVWVPAMAGLVRAHRVVAPDLPGLGASRVEGPQPPAARVLAWLGELIDRTCPTPPVVVGASLGGSIAARFAAASGDHLAGLVLVGTGGLVDKVRIPPPMLLALVRHGVRPSERTAMAMLRQVSVDVDRVQRRMGALGAVPGLLAGAGPHPQRAPRQPAPAARARPGPDPARGGRPHRRAHEPHLGAGGPGDAAGGRPGGQCPIWLAPGRDRRRRPFPGGRPAGGVPAGAAAGTGAVLRSEVHGRAKR